MAGKIIIVSGARLTRKKNKETGKYTFYNEYVSNKTKDPVIRFSVTYPSGKMFQYEDFVLFGAQAKIFKQLVKDGKIICDAEKNTVLTIYAKEFSDTYDDKDGGEKVSRSYRVDSLVVEKIAKRGEKSESEKDENKSEDEYMKADEDEYPYPEETKPKTVTPTKPAPKPNPAEPSKTAARPDTAAKPKTAARPGTTAKPKPAPRPSVNAVGNIVGKYLNGSGDDPFLSN